MGLKLTQDGLNVTLTVVDPKTGDETIVPPTSITLIQGDPKTGEETVIQTLYPKPPWYKRAWYWILFHAEAVFNVMRWWS